jgi:hypothetical protein
LVDSINSTVSYLLGKPSIKGEIIITKFEVTDLTSCQGHFIINAKFKESIPEAFKMFITPKEIELPSKRNNSFLSIFKK